MYMPGQGSSCPRTKLVLKNKPLSSESICWPWLSSSVTGLPDFSCRNLPKLGKIYQKDHKCSKWSQNIPISHKIYRMAIKDTKIFHCKAFQKISKLGFSVWKNTSGSPGLTTQVAFAWHDKWPYSGAQQATDCVVNLAGKLFSGLPKKKISSLDRKVSLYARVTRCVF
jgi:hypothetical protein